MRAEAACCHWDTPPSGAASADTILFYPVDLLEDRGNGVLQVAQAREYVTDSQGNQAFKQLAGGSGRKSSFATVCNGGGGQRRICSALHTFAHLNWRSSSPLGSMS